MSASIALATATQAGIGILNKNQPENNQSEVTKTYTSRQSIDPRSANTLSPRQSDAILSLVSTDSSRTSSNSDKSETLSVPASHRAYQDTFRSALDEDDDGDGDINLPEISVGPGGSTDGDGSAPVAPSGGGGETAPAEGAGGSSTPVGGSSGTSSGVVPDPNADPHTRVTFQEALPSTYATLFAENPRGFEIGNEDMGAVAIGQNSGLGNDGSIWSTEKIIFKTEKGTFFANPSRPGDVVIARIIDGYLDVTSATPS